MSQYNLAAIENVLKQGIPIGTAFDMVLADPFRFCRPTLAKAISENLQAYTDEFKELRLKGGYSIHLHGTHVLRKLFSYGFPEAFLIEYVVYPRTYQFRTHMPFIKNIKPARMWNSLKTPIIPHH